MKSNLRTIGSVKFPAFQVVRLYMVPFYKANIPFELADWKDTIESMLIDIDTTNVIYATVDQAIIKANSYHRRPGPHVDGNWRPAIKNHNGESIPDTGGHGAWPPTHIGKTELPLPLTPIKPIKAPVPVKPKTKPTKNQWVDFDPEALILASNIKACRAFVGEFNEFPLVGGDCSHIDFSNMEEIHMEPNIAYSGNVSMIHESLMIPFDCERSLIRLNVPGVEI